MEPQFINGQIVWVKQQNYLEDGEIGIFFLDGSGYIKKLQDNKDGHNLISLNKAYKPIPIVEDSNFMIFGKVIGQKSHIWDIPYDRITTVAIQTSFY